MKVIVTQTLTRTTEVELLHAYSIKELKEVAIDFAKSQFAGNSWNNINLSGDGEKYRIRAIV
tara:strand:+ start:632 stop:817 length:186 start_codon:yes stop_codon:yes gene_type:complete